MNQVSANAVEDTPRDYQYEEAFSRNIGWVTSVEQHILRARRVAVAGVGGVGGIHLLTLTRLGVGKFNIADLDHFELGNFNRQAGAFLHNLGRPKVDVMATMARDINPELELNSFPNGVTLDNIDEFLEGVDLYIDGLDFFVLDIRRAVFAACAKRGIPALTAAPLGMGVAFLAFLPGQMTFEEYFRLEGCSPEEQQMRFMLGLSPTMLQRDYLADPSRVRFGSKKGPSTPMACELCAGVTATNALKLLLNRGKVLAAPRGLHFDAYHNRLRTTWRPGGNNNPVQRLMMVLVRRFLRNSESQPTAPADKLETAMERILDLARWAPSGDNTQPWRFEIVDEMHLRIHAQDTRDWCFYDLQGQASQIAVGALLETIAIAATAENLSARFDRVPDAPQTSPVIDVFFDKQNIEPSELVPFIKARSTNRRAFSKSPLTDLQKKALEDSVGEDYRIIWIEGKLRRQMAKLLFKSAKIRLTTQEGYQVHSRIIEWGCKVSADRIPDQAVGVDPLTTRLMQWALASWSRVKFLNRFLAGTWLPRIQMDFVPGLNCAAHFILLGRTEHKEIDDFVQGGRALQRFWLTASRLGLQFQPEMTPLIFSRYSADGEVFTSDKEALKLAHSVAEDLNGFLQGTEIRKAVFMGRLGRGVSPTARSTRLSLSQLLQT